MGYCFGIDIGGTTIKMGFFSKEDGLIEKWEIPTRKGADPTPLLEDIAVAVEDCLKRHGVEKKDVLGMGMAAPGPVAQDGIVRGTVNIGWGDVDLGSEGAKVVGISPVFVGNDARVAALGEATYGAGAGVPSLLMLTLGTGVGGGLIENGRIHIGATGTAGEIGHLTMDLEERELCNCGKAGCLEQIASATGMVRVAQKFLSQTEAPSVLRNEKITAQSLWDAAKAGDALALEICQYVSRMLGIAIANACYITDPHLIIIGGGVSAAGEFLLNMVKDSYRQFVFPQCRDKGFALAKLRNDAGIYGAASLVFTNELVGLHKKHVL